MIGFVRGKILDLTPETALLETASGIGFELYITGAAYSEASGKKECGLYSYLQAREDGVTLFGFASKEEKEMFLKLISVSGVGPKLGIAVLSGMRAGDVAAAIAKSDVKRLSSVKGMGKKTAERLILELREKVAASPASSSSEPVPVMASDGDEDAIVALMTLGFNRAESAKAISKARAQGASSVEDIIMLALKGM